ncbi:flavodoxin family protein [Chloroflexota bacterium]
MKAIGIVGSPRKNGNTEIVTRHTLRAIEEEAIETELITLAGLNIQLCDDCGACASDETCPIDDNVFPIYQMMKAADAIILASPVYYGSATALMKAFIERISRIGRNLGRIWSGKVGGALVVARRAGKNFTLAELNFWFQIKGFIIPGSTYWNVAIGRDKGDVQKDTEGLKTAWNFGKNVAFLVKKLST